MKDLIHCSLAIETLKRKIELFLNMFKYIYGTNQEKLFNSTTKKFNICIDCSICYE